MMQLEVTVHAAGEYWYGGTKVEVPEPMLKAFEPINTCDEPVVAFITGDVMKDSFEVKETLKVREDAVEYLSKAIAASLVAEMKKLDKHNGY